MRREVKVLLLGLSMGELSHRLMDIGVAGAAKKSSRYEKQKNVIVVPQLDCIELPAQLGRLHMLPVASTYRNR